MEFKREYFDFFVSEINKYVDGVNFLNPGIEDEHIDEVERKLETKFPEEYKAFLRIYNGGEIFRPGTIMSEIYIDPNTKVVGGSYVNDSFNENRRLPGLPDEYLIIADLSYGDLVCIDVSEHQPLAKIVLWSFEESEVSMSWESLKEWLEEELDDGRALFDYDGSRKTL